MGTNDTAPEDVPAGCVPHTLTRDAPTQSRRGYQRASSHPRGGETGVTSGLVVPRSSTRRSGAAPPGANATHLRTSLSYHWVGLAGQYVQGVGPWPLGYAITTQLLVGSWPFSASGWRFIGGDGPRLSVTKKNHPVLSGTSGRASDSMPADTSGSTLHSVDQAPHKKHRCPTKKKGLSGRDPKPNQNGPGRHPGPKIEGNLEGMTRRLGLARGSRRRGS